MNRITPSKGDEFKDESLEYMQGISIGTYSFTRNNDSDRDDPEDEFKGIGQIGFIRKDYVFKNSGTGERDK